MGAVYVAHHIGLKKHVAIKILSRELMGADPNVQRFLREAQLAARLDHLNIVTVYDVGEAQGVYYLVMQYVEGPSLDKVLEVGGAMAAGDVAGVLLQVSSALTAAHKMGVVHRDIKPGNVMLMRDGTVKVADFGLARSLDASMSLSGTGQIIGTPHYMAPEQAQGQIADQRADIYSLGATFYHLVAGRPPFTAETPIAVVLKHVQEVAVPPHEIVPAVPPSVSAVIAKMMAKAPADRPQSCEEVTALLGGLKLERLPDTNEHSLARRLEIAMVGKELGPEVEALAQEILKKLPKPSPAATSKGDAAQRELTAADTVRVPGPVEEELPDLGGITMLDLGGPEKGPEEKVTQEKGSDTSARRERSPAREFVAPPPPAFDVSEITKVRRRQAQPAQDNNLAFAELAARLGYVPNEEVEKASQEVQEMRVRGEFVALGHVLLRRKAISLPQFIQVAEELAGSALQESVENRKDIDFGSYKLVKPILEDDDAIVWEAEEKKQGLLVALRFMKGTEAEMAKRLYQEAALGRELEHPHILRVYDAGSEVDGKNQLVHFMAVQRIQACTLADAIAGRTLTVAKAVELFQKVAGAVRHAHEKNIFHGGLKPSDILIDATDKPVVLYTGLSSTQGGGARAATMATVAYVAPEQTPGREQEVDARTDIYRLGAILYEALCGRPPFEGSTVADAMRRIAEKEPEPLRKLNPDVPAHVAAAVKRAMERDRNARFATVAEFVAALGDAKIPEGAVPPPTSAKTPKQPQPAPVAPRPAAAPRPRPMHRVSRGQLMAIAGAILVCIVVAVVGAILLQKGPGGGDNFAQRAADARDRLRQGDYQGAITAAEAALKIKDDPDMRSVQAQCRRKLVEPRIQESLQAVRKAPAEGVGEAIERLESALRDSDPLLGDPAIMRDRAFAELVGVASAAANQYDRAERCLQRAVDLGSSDAALLLTLAWMRAERWLVMRRLVDPSWGGGECGPRLADGLRKAQESLRHRTAPERTGADLARAAALFALIEGDSAKALALANAGLEMHASAVGADDFYVIQAAAGDADRRLRACGELSARSPQRAIGYVIRAIEFLDEGKPDEALADGELAVRMAPGNGAIRALRGLCREHKGELGPAIEDYTHALRADPKFVDALLRRARLRAASSDPQGARNDCDAAIAANPGYAISYVVRGSTRQLGGDNRGAGEDYRAAMERPPRVAMPHVFLGQLLLEDKNLKEAIGAFENALKIDPKSPDAFAGRAMTRLAAGDKSAAIEDLKYALLYAPDGWSQKERVTKLLAENEK